MDFVDLDRDFVRLDADVSHDIERSYVLGLYGRNSYKWSGLLSLRRVVVLGDAASGKSSEFKEQRRKISEEDGFALYLTIERLSQRGLQGSLSVVEREAFEVWSRSATPGWFFLDSVDEARINHRDVKAALDQFALELGAAYVRAHVYISCRGNVWEGRTDRELIENALPLIEETHSLPEVDADTALFLRRSDRKSEGSDAAREPQQFDLVAFGPLTFEQRRNLIVASQVEDPDAFETAIYAHGLDPLAQRPGDLLMLIAYWRENQRFGSFTEMTEFGIAQRLKEEGEGRQQSIGLDELTIRKGAERLAAALTLARQMEFVLPGADVSTGSVDPYAVLYDWKRTDVRGLLHRGLFVPSTYGRIRFFHRSGQEYLTARWFLGLMPSLGTGALSGIFLSDRYGLSTVPPSLRAAAAWIAAEHKPLREELLRRTPQVLMFEGDPGALELDDRRQLLRLLAENERDGKVTDRHLDPRPLWMFAREELADSINDAVKINPREAFRFTMLQLIEAGKIRGCRNLLVDAAADRENYGAVLAIRTLRDLDDKAALAAIASDLLAASSPLPAGRTPAVVEILFPQALTIGEVLMLVGRTVPARRYELEGYRTELLNIFEACETQSERDELLGGIADLAFEEPLEDWPVVSQAHHQLVAQATDLARAAIARSDTDGITPNLLRFLKAVGRAGEDDHLETGPQLTAMVADRPVLCEALFWADFADRETAVGETPNLHQVGGRGETLWTFDARQEGWLTAALKRSDPDERAMALSILSRLYRDDEEKLDELAARVRDDARLANQLADYRKPYEPSPIEVGWAKRDAEIKLKSAKREEDRRERLRRLRAEVTANVSRLSDPETLLAWPGPAKLVDLTYWLGARGTKGRNFDQSVQAWPELAEAFGRPVADAYHAGIRTLWRVTEPERPRHRKERRTIKYTIILSMSGLALEASESADWARRLTPQEADRAIRHVCLDDQGVPEWLGSLAKAHPNIVHPHLERELTREWQAPSDYAPFISHILRAGLVALVANKLLALMKGRPPRHGSRFESGAQALLQMQLSPGEAEKLAAHFARRHRRATQSGDNDLAHGYLRLTIAADPHAGGAELIALLEKRGSAKDRARGWALLKSLFSRHHGSVVPLERFGAPLLARLTDVAYAIATPEAQEESRRGGDDPRDALLNGLLRMDGEEAILAVRSLTTVSSMRHLRHRLIELGNEIAERAADRKPWTAAMVRNFEKSQLAPITSGEDLFALACLLLDAIQWEFDNEDLSDRSVVQSAQDEGAVRDWLGRTLERLGGGRFSANRESQVAGQNRPDLMLTGGEPAFELAIEVKHDEKGWTLPALRDALHRQLAGQYLLPANRRHGILVISNHRDNKFWRDRDRKRRISFAELITRLQQEANAIDRNGAGYIRVAVKPIDAAPGRRQPAPEKDKGR